MARVTKVNSDGSLEIYPSFIPPSLNILKNKVAEKSLSELHSFIQQKTRNLAELFVNQNTSKSSIAPQITDSLMLQLLNRYDAYCKNIFQSPSTHPQNFIHEMVLFSSELATYTSESRTGNNFLTYNHMDIEKNLTEVVEELKSQLNITIERDATEVQLKRNNYGTFDSKYMPPDLVAGAYYIMSVSCQQPKDHIKKYFSGQCKIAATSQMERYIRSLTTGIRIEPLVILPPSIPYRHECVNFQLKMDEDSLEAWQQIVDEKAISFHVTGDYPDLKINLWLVKREKMNG